MSAALAGLPPRVARASGTHAQLSAVHLAAPTGSALRRRHPVNYRLLPYVNGGHACMEWPSVAGLIVLPPTSQATAERQLRHRRQLRTSGRIAGGQQLARHAPHMWPRTIQASYNSGLSRRCTWRAELRLAGWRPLEAHGTQRAQRAGCHQPSRCSAARSLHRNAGRLLTSNLGRHECQPAQAGCGGPPGGAVGARSTGRQR